MAVTNLSDRLLSISIGSVPPMPTPSTATTILPLEYTLSLWKARNALTELVNSGTVWPEHPFGRLPVVVPPNYELTQLIWSPASASFIQSLLPSGPITMNLEFQV